MKNNKKILIILASVIVVTIVIICGYLIHYRSNQIELLNNEVSLMLKKDFIKDDYAIEIKTEGDYAYIEEKIKSYYKELSDNIKIIYSYLNNEDLIKILSADNLKTDGPNFKKSYQTLNSARENIDIAMNSIISLCSEMKIRGYVEKDKVSGYYYDLYLDYMFSKDELAYLEATQSEFKILKDNLDIFLNKVEAILDMLKKNKNYWYIEDGFLYFKTTSLVNKYNNLYNDLNSFVKEKFSDYSINTN